jgi:hypothetical protein
MATGRTACRGVPVNRAALVLAPLLLAAASAPALPAQDGPIAPATSHHALATPAGRLDYDAVFEQQVLSGADGQPAATISTIAYLRSGTADVARPVIFAFNGGPGASSSPLHIDAMGPRRAIAPAWSTTSRPRSIAPTWCSSIPLAPGSAARSGLVAVPGSGAWRAMPAPWPRRSPVGWPCMAAPVRR